MHTSATAPSSRSPSPRRGSQSLRRHARRRRLAALAVIAGLAGAPAREVVATAAAAADSAPTSAAAERPYPTLGSILGAWNEHLARVEVAPEDREAEARAFLQRVPWDRFMALCGTAGPALPPDSLSMLQTMIGLRLEGGGPGVAAIAAALESPTCRAPCKWPLLDWEWVRRDSLAAGERRRLALAELRAAAPGLPVQMRRRLLTGAAELSAADTLMTVMMARARGAEQGGARLGVRMLGVSRDRRAPDSLAVLLRELAEGSGDSGRAGNGNAPGGRGARQPVLDEALIQCRASCAEQVVETLIRLYDTAGTAQRRQHVLFALARAPRTGAMQVLLDAYADGGLVADSTFTLDGAARRPYYDLWLATRIAEPVLNGWLREGSESCADLAVELFDRMLRFGPPIEAAGVAAALEAWRARAPAPARSRAAAVLDRARRPPPLP